MKIPINFKLPLLILLWAFVTIIIIVVIMFLYGMYLGFADPSIITG